MSRFPMAMGPSCAPRASRLAAAGASLLLLCSVAAAQARPDHVLWRNARGQVNTVVGKVTENSLTEVVVDTGSSQRKLDGTAVELVEFGDVPQAVTDARAYFERGDFENAAAKYALAAGDGSARAVVRAHARLSAAESWLKHGRGNESALESARKDCELFLSEHPTNRAAPQARLLLGRILRLSGDGPKAAETYAALFREAAAATPGYPPLVCFRAGLGAGEAYLLVKDAAKARETYLALESAIGTALANLPDGDPLRVEFAAVQSEARLGEGFCLMAAGSLAQAKTFFQGQASGAESNPVKRFGAQLGLGEVLLAEGNARAAQVEFAQVSAIDHTSKDRSARALVGLAESALKLQAKADAKAWLDAVRTQYGDTPAALKAHELAKNL
jgi:TolA-binding protein